MSVHQVQGGEVKLEPPIGWNVWTRLQGWQHGRCLRKLFGFPRCGAKPISEPSTQDCPGTVLTGNQRFALVVQGAAEIGEFRVLVREDRWSTGRLMISCMDSQKPADAALSSLIIRQKEIDSRLGMDQGRWLQRLQLAAFRLDHPCIGEEPEPQ